jgi:hypothetical protein
MLGVTPSELGKIRRERPTDIAFFERYLSHEIEVQQKATKERERKLGGKKIVRRK